MLDVRLWIELKANAQKAKAQLEELIAYLDDTLSAIEVWENEGGSYR